MKKILAALCLSALPLFAAAGTSSESLSGCLADNTTGKDRKEMAIWIFMAMAAHPDMRDFSSITPEVRNNINQKIGGLVTRLIAVNCAQQARSAMKDGGEAFKNAFEVLGRLAMQELMSNGDVSKSIQGFMQYVDQKKFTSTFQSK